MFIFNSKKEKEKAIEENIKQLDSHYARMAIEIERLKALGQKIDRIETKLRGLDDILSVGGMKLQPRTVSIKTKEAIKMILQKYGQLTSAQLSRLIKLSRTRCNEYLKELEEEGLTISKIDSRKKFYSIRQ